MPNNWQSILDEIKSRVSDMAYLTYFPRLKFISLEGGVLKLSAPNPFIKQQIESKYRMEVIASVRSLGLECETIEVEIASSEPVNKTRAVEIVPNEPLGSKIPEAKPVAIPTPTSTPVKTEASMKMPKIQAYTPVHSVPNNVTHSKNPRFDTSNDGLNAEYRLATYVIGSNNDLAVSAAQQVIENPGIRFNPYFIYGGAGTGKTHLIQAIGNEIKIKHPELKVLFVTIEQFYHDFVESMRKKIDGFAEKYRSVDVLIIDDFQFIVGKEKSQEEFFHTFNELHNHNKQIIISSDRLPSQIATVDQRLASRLMMGVPIDIGFPDFETRCAIVKQKAELKGYSLDNRTVEFIAQSAKSNIRELEGNLNRILLLADVRGVDPSELVDDSMDTPAENTFAPSMKQRAINPRAVIDTVAKYYGLDTNDLLGKSRLKDIKTARQIAMYIMNEELSLSTVRIGQEFSKDHTTIMHGIKVVKENLKTDFNLRSQMTELRDKIYG